MLYAKKIQNEWFDVAMIESYSLTLDPNDDPSTPVFVAFVKRNFLVDTAKIKHLMLESITDFDINGKFAANLSALLQIFHGIILKIIQAQIKILRIGIMFCIFFTIHFRKKRIQTK